MISLYARHSYALAAIVLAAVYAPHWAIPTTILVLYAIDLVLSLLSGGDTSSESSETTPVPLGATTSVDFFPPQPVATSTPPTPPEGLPIHDLHRLQSRIRLPPDAAITVDGDTDNPWNRALQLARSSGTATDAATPVETPRTDQQTFSSHQTLTYGDDFDPTDIDPSGEETQ